MDESKSLAIELAKALIQNNNVRPIYNTRSNNRDNTRDILFALDDTTYTFSELVVYFLENINKIENWD